MELRSGVCEINAHPRAAQTFEAPLPTSQCCEGAQSPECLVACEINAHFCRRRVRNKRPFPSRPRPDRGHNNIEIRGAGVHTHAACRHGVGVYFANTGPAFHGFRRGLRDQGVNVKRTHPRTRTPRETQTRLWPRFLHTDPRINCRPRPTRGGPAQAPSLPLQRNARSTPTTTCQRTPCTSCKEHAGTAEEASNCHTRLCV